MRYSLDNGAYAPTIAHIGEDAGIDLKTPVSVVVPTGGSVVIDTGVHIELPHNTFGKLESKSGLNIKDKIVCLGGVIDEGYTGPIVTRIYNFGETDFMFFPGDKIVQLVIIPVIYAKELIECTLEELVEIKSNSSRKDDGFGSTGK